MFEGLFDHDMIEGNGIFYKRNGEIIIGFWIDNKLFLNQSYEHEKKWKYSDSWFSWCIKGEIRNICYHFEREICLR